MKSEFCKNCGLKLKIHKGHNYCPYCGQYIYIQSIQNDSHLISKDRDRYSRIRDRYPLEKFCDKCGKSNKQNAKFCKYCGHDLRNDFFF